MACLTNYTVQCVDIATGQKGCFLFNTEHWRKTGEFLAVSPVFDNLDKFYAWDNANGNNRRAIYLERDK